MALDSVAVGVTKVCWSSDPNKTAAARASDSVVIRGMEEDEGGDERRSGLGGGGSINLTHRELWPFNKRDVIVNNSRTHNKSRSATCCHNQVESGVILAFMDATTLDRVASDEEREASNPSQGGLKLTSKHSKVY